MHLTLPPPLPQRCREAVRAVSQASVAVRPPEVVCDFSLSPFHSFALRL